MITRYTTPYHYFILPIKYELIQSVYITYSQNGVVLLDKSSNDDITIYDPAAIKSASVFDEDGAPIIESTETVALTHLTQEDTSKFKHYPAEEKNIALIQVRVISKSGESYVSRVIYDRIYGALKEEVIDG